MHVDIYHKNIIYKHTVRFVLASELTLDPLILRSVRFL